MTNAPDEKLDAALRFDALDTAERITGADSADKNSPALGLGFLLMQENGARKEALLKARGDTVFSSDLDYYLHVIEGNGYIRVLENKFVGHDDVEETFFVYAHPDGLLLKFDTYHGDLVNSGNVYYNWRPSGAEWWQFISSGGLSRRTEEEIFVGHHDAREALIFNMDRLRQNGEFVTPWVERPWLWLLHYMDTKVDGYDHKAITEERISRLPQWVKDFVGEARE